MVCNGARLQLERPTESPYNNFHFEDQSTDRSLDSIHRVDSIRSYLFYCHGESYLCPFLNILYCRPIGWKPNCCCCLS
uniref:Uncharacterized protein n=1 Tax=Pararge aegeria TaxID=116150 RepID=S4PHS8_9NEOP